MWLGLNTWNNPTASVSVWFPKALLCKQNLNFSEEPPGWLEVVILACLYRSKYPYMFPGFVLTIVLHNPSFFFFMIPWLNSQFNRTLLHSEVFGQVSTSAGLEGHESKAVKNPILQLWVQEIELLIDWSLYDWYWAEFMLPCWISKEYSVCLSYSYLLWVHFFCCSMKRRVIDWLHGKSHISITHGRDPIKKKLISRCIIATIV